MRYASLILAVLLMACAPSGGGPAPVANLDGAWTARSIAGKPVVPPGSITLALKNGQATGNGGCNSYVGGFETSGDKIKFGPIASTMMACGDPERMQQENEYHLLLRAVATYTLPAPGELVLRTADGRALLFVRTS
jgi:heat shock protein HslJ